MKNLLTCDINRRTHMSYDSRQRCSKGRATQSGAHASSRAGTPARGRRTLGPRLVRYQAPSLSLPPARPATQTTRSGRRCQSIFYRQAFPPFGRKAEGVCRLHRFDAERDRQPSGAGGPSPWGRPWLTTLGVGNARCGGNIDLIGCGQRSWPRFMNAWCLTPCSSPCGPRPHCPGTIRRF
jgi:hypothetical protein